MDVQKLFSYSFRLPKAKNKEVCYLYYFFDNLRDNQKHTKKCRYQHENQNISVCERESNEGMGDKVVSIIVTKLFYKYHF